MSTGCSNTKHRDVREEVAATLVGAGRKCMREEDEKRKAPRSPRTAQVQVIGEKKIPLPLPNGITRLIYPAEPTNQGHAAGLECASRMSRVLAHGINSGLRPAPCTTTRLEGPWGIQSHPYKPTEASLPSVVRMPPMITRESLSRLSLCSPHRTARAGEGGKAEFGFGTQVGARASGIQDKSSKL